MASSQGMRWKGVATSMFRISFHSFLIRPSFRVMMSSSVTKLISRSTWVNSG